MFEGGRQPDNLFAFGGFYFSLRQHSLCHVYDIRYINWSRMGNINGISLSSCPYCFFLRHIDCYAVWTNQVAEGLCMKHQGSSIQWLASRTLLWQAYFNIVWGVPQLQWIMGSRDRWKFSQFLKGHWQSPFTAGMTGKCISLGLCKETVK